jgi:hypothetical protein
MPIAMGKGSSLRSPVIPEAEAPQGRSYPGSPVGSSTPEIPVDGWKDMIDGIIS